MALCLASPALAETRLTAEDFESTVEGRTFYYVAPDAEPQGIEAYTANRKVVFAFLNDTCVEGFWYAGEDDWICFVYPTLDVEQCWFYWREGEEIMTTSDTGGVFELQETTDRVPCLGPSVGV